jgi:hypothetical protein
MTTRDFGFITLRNAVAYRPDNSVVPPNNVLVTSTNGAAVFSDNIRISTINASTITSNNINISTINASTITANNINISTINASTITANNINISTISASTLDVNTINASLVSTTNLVTDTISTYNQLVFFDNNLSTLFVTSQASTLFVDGFPVLTEGNISSISSLYWNDLPGGTIYNKNIGTTPNNYLVGIGTNGSALNATLDVRYTGTDTGNVFNVSTTTGNNFNIDNNGVVTIKGVTSTSVINMSTSVGSQGQIIGLSTINGLAWPPVDDALWSQTGSNLYADNLAANVGIGTITPQYKLDVTGSVRASTFVSTSLLNMSTSTGSKGQIIGLSTINGLAWPPVDDALWSQTGNNLYADNLAANVGIGTISPQYKLDVTGSVRASTFVSTSVINMLTSVGNQGQIVGLSTINGLTWPPVDDALWSQSGSNLYTDNLAANVGIGTTTPQYKLDVTGSIRANTFVSTSLLNMSTSIGSQGQIIGLSTINGLAWPPTDDALWSQSGSNLYPDDLTANVGIGTATPQAKLDVVGNLSVSGNLVVTGTAISKVVCSTINTNPGATSSWPNFYGKYCFVTAVDSDLEPSNGAPEGAVIVFKNKTDYVITVYGTPIGPGKTLSWVYTTVLGDGGSWQSL